MLLKVSIRNYAIITHVDIEFGPGLNIITGETGAGKSILAGALGLALGDRADSSLLKDRNQKLVVEAWFQLPVDAVAANWLRSADLEPSDPVICRREILPGGKSRAFVNDSPVQVSQLLQIGGLLADMHQQDERLDGSAAGLPYAIIDSIAGNEQDMAGYREIFYEFQAVGREISRKKQDLEQSSRELDYNRFLLDELKELGLRPGELESLEEEIRLLTHAGQLQQAMDRVRMSMEEGEAPQLQVIRSMLQQLQSVASFHPALGEVIQRLTAVQVELRDIASDLSSMSANLPSDEGNLDILNTRLAQGQKLLRKHGVQDTAALLDLEAELSRKLAVTSHTAAELDELQSRLDALHARLTETALHISGKRKNAIPGFEKAITSMLVKVGMPAARLRMLLEEQEPGSMGIDRVQLMFDANRSNRFEPLEKVASGGERSRLMLCLKSMLAHHSATPTLIFDEIDSGISGEAARQVGWLMKELSASHQVISITHQVQIAARADKHLYVFKKEVSGEVQALVTELKHEERVEALARMMGGDHPGKHALENAREMIMDNKVG